MLHAGVDMHKRFSVVTVLDEDGEELVSGRRLNNEDQEIIDFLAELEGDVKVVLEAGSNWQWMCDLLDDQGIDNRLCHPLKTKAIASAKIKTDKLDSRILSQLSRMDFVPEAYKPDIETRQLRELLRYRASLVSMRTRVKNKIHAILTRLNVQHPYTDLFGKAGTAFLEQLELSPVYRNALDGYLNLLQALNAEIKKAVDRVNQEFSISHEAKLLETIPRVGKILAMTIVAEIANIDRFQTSRQLSSYAGIVPSTSQSGNSTRHGHITRQGSRWLRWAFVEAAIHAATRPGPLRKYYLKLSRRKGNKIARVAVARKISTHVFYMLRDGKEFNQVADYCKSDLG